MLLFGITNQIFGFERAELFNDNNILTNNHWERMKNNGTINGRLLVLSNVAIDDFRSRHPNENLSDYMVNVKILGDDYRVMIFRQGTKESPVLGGAYEYIINLESSEIESRKVFK